MKKAQEYREHAAECRALARNAQNVEHRNQLLEMADTWEGLAAQRERLLLEQKYLDDTATKFPATTGQRAAQQVR